MALVELRCSNFRVFESLEYQPSGGINLITGANGAGKTSILEAIYLLSVGRSFKTHQQQPLVRYGQSQLVLFGIQSIGGIQHKVGLKKEKGKKDEIRLDGQTILRLSDLARIQPVQVLTPGSHRILEMEAEYRRRFVEWGLFHVEHDYLQKLSKYRKTLSQRNALVKDGKSTDSWDHLLSSAAENVNSSRQRYVEELKPYYERELAELELSIQPGLVWHKGWKNELSFRQQLVHDRSTDLRLGYTHSGPQRADLRILEKGQASSKTLSRGQQKMLLLALKLAQGELLKKKTGRSTVYLLDDLMSELDKKNRLTVLGRLSRLCSQVIITSAESLEFEDSACSVFHVEH